jgi:tetratricopeptide (TPR) repeat protein
MNDSNEAGVLIAQALREEENKQRRRTLLLSSVPVVIGLVVLGTVTLFVDRKMKEVARLDAEVAQLDTEVVRLDAEVAQLDAAKMKLRDEIAVLSADANELFRSNERAHLLVEQVERHLPEKARQETELLKLGIEQVAGGNYEAASESYQAALALDPANKLALTWQGEAYLREGRDDEALASFARAIELDPSLAQAHYDQGIALFRSGQQAEGLRAIERAFLLEPSYQARAYGDPGFIPVRDYMERTQGQASAASATEQELIEEGLALAKQGNLDGAIRFYDAALAENPENKLVWNWRGYAQYRKGDYPAAIASLDHAIELDPEYAEAHYNRGLALWRAGDGDAAIESVDRAFLLKPDYEKRAMQDPQFRGLRDARARRIGSAS